ncbi:MAG TPA: 50S ribosomal protein L35 [Candidatus Paceibacterota bacterium]|nr:50S ribosomal protein L35 [Candidatus Paceibacterota bacterium]
MKTAKSFSKRLKVTKNGKVLARKPGQNHFNAKESSRSQMQKHKNYDLHIPNKVKSRVLVNM